MLKCSRYFAVFPSLLLLAPWQSPAESFHAESVLATLTVSPQKSAWILPRASQRQEAPTHTVKKGETLWRISREHKISIDELKQLNNLTTDDPIIVEGQKLRLPSGATPPKPTTPATSDANPTSADAPSITHVVVSGETLFRIAQRHGISVADLQAANQITDPTSIQVGTKLRIPGVAAAPKPKDIAVSPSEIAAKPKPAETTSPAPFQDVAEPIAPPIKALPQVVPAPPDRQNKAPAGYGIYVVQAGDTATSIASTYGITTRELRRINNVTNPNYAPQTGEFVLVPSDGSWYVPKSQRTAQSLSTSRFQIAPPSSNPIPTKPAEVSHHLVKIGPNDSLEVLARRYGTTTDQIKLDNPKIKSNRDLRVGMELRVRNDGTNSP